MNKFQKFYILVFIFSLFGLVGNIELGIKTAIHCWLIFITSGILTTGKFIYLIKKGGI